MMARGMVVRVVLVLVLACCAFGSRAQDGRQPVRKDQLLGVESFGAVAMVHDRVSSIREATLIKVLDRGVTVSFARRTTCVGVISHHDRNVKASSYFGVQIIRAFRPGTMGQAVFVRRNGGWVSRIDGKSLPGMMAPRQVRVPSVDEFGQKHKSLEELLGLTFGDGQPIANLWHASLVADQFGNPKLDTADDDNRPFWNAPPWTDSAFQEALKASLEPGSVLRLDNHLISFQVTDGISVHTAIPFEFPCSESDLTVVALRIFVPLKAEAPWYILKMTGP